MAGGEIGRLKVRVLPDSTRFARDLKKSLDRLEKRARLDVSLNLPAREVARLRKQIESAAAEIKVGLNESGLAEKARAVAEGIERVTERSPAKVPVELGDLDGQFASRVRSQVQKATRGIEALIPATVEGEEMRRDLAAQVRALEETLNVSVPVEPEKAAEWRADIQRMVSEIESLEPALQVKAKPEQGSFTRLRLQIAELTRNRVVRVAVIAGTIKGLTGLRELTAPSGARALADLNKHILDSVRNLDRAAPGMARLAGTLGAIASLTFSKLGVLTSSLDDLGRLPGLLLPVPAILAGLGTVGGILYAVLGDAGAYIGDLGEQFSNLQDMLSGAFWAKAETGVRNFVAAFMPLAREYLPAIASHLGQFAISMAAAFESSAGQESLAAFFRNLSAAVEAMGDGMGYLMESILNLVRAGSQYLPAMGEAFTRQMETFAAWTDQISRDGSFEAFVSRAVDAAKSLGSILDSTLGIIGAFADAAREAGTRGLQGVADGLNLIENTLKSPAWQTGLTTYFQGANDAMDRMVPGLSALAGAFLELAPTMADVMRLSGDIASVAFKGLAEIATNPQFQAGLVGLFEGARSAAESLLEVAPQIGDKIGHILGTAGVFADVFGRVLAEAIRLFEPVLAALLTTLQTLAPVMGELLVGAMEALAPLILPVVSAISDWVKQNPRLAGTLLMAAGAIGAIMTGLVGLIAFLAPAIGAVATLVGAVGGAPVAIGAAVVAAIALLAGLVVAIVANWEAIKARTVEIWEGIKQAVINAWNGLVAWVESGGVAGFFGSLSAAWNDGWAALTGGLVAVWETVKASIGLGLVIIGEVLRGGMGILAALWAGDWARVGEIVATAWASISEALSAWWGTVSESWATWWAGIEAAWNDGWARIGEVLSGAWAEFTRILGEKMVEVGAFFQNLPDDIAAFLADLPERLRDMGTDMIQGLVDGITSMGQAVKDAIGGVANGAIEWGKDLLGIRSPSRVFHKIGVYTGQGLSNGMESQARNVQRSMEAMLPNSRAVDLGVIASAQASESERTYQDERAAALIADALENIKVVLDGRRVVGGLKQTRAWQGG